MISAYKIIICLGAVCNSNNNFAIQFILDKIYIDAFNEDEMDIYKNDGSSNIPCSFSFCQNCLFKWAIWLIALLHWHLIWKMNTPLSFSRPRKLSFSKMIFKFHFLILLFSSETLAEIKWCNWNIYFTHTSNELCWLLGACKQHYEIFTFNWCSKIHSNYILLGRIRLFQKERLTVAWWAHKILIGHMSTQTQVEERWKCIEGDQWISRWRSGENVCARVCVCRTPIFIECLTYNVLYCIDCLIVTMSQLIINQIEFHKLIRLAWASADLVSICFYGIALK